MISRVFDGDKEGLSRDDVLDNITLFWLTNTAISAARLYRENKFPFSTVKGVTVPMAVSVFPDELYGAPRSWAEKAYPKLIHYNRSRKAGISPRGSSRKASVMKSVRDFDHFGSSSNSRISNLS